MTLNEIAQAIESVAPRPLQESYDNAGLQCGIPHQEVSRVLCCLDVTEAIVEEAHQRGCQLIVSHHPLLFRGTKSINPEADYISRTLMLAIRYGIGLYAAHTNLDKAVGGMNHRLAEILELSEVQPMSECGVYGRLPHPMTADELLHHIKQSLGDVPVRCNNDAHQQFTTQSHKLTMLALCTGSGSDFIAEAEALGADAYLTGEMHYHAWFGHPNLLIVEAGHYETESMAAQLLSQIISNALPQVECLCADEHCPTLTR